MPEKSFNSEAVNFQPTDHANSVRVENISARATPDEVVELFKTLIGSVKSFCNHPNSQGVFLDIAFWNPDAATKALCMSGYNIHGTPLFVSPVSVSTTNVTSKRQNDDRKNLYVLGLPFSLTKTEFTALFSRYGTVTHSVILATVDNSSRRRGFVVMSTHGEAKLAMASLTRTQIKGHCLDVSWAVVQRSQGFLDGGDRAILLDLRPPSNSLARSSANSSPDISLDFSTSSNSSKEDFANLAPSFLPTATIFAMNLPTILFSDVKDMSPLFCPFGGIKKLHVMETSSSTSISVLVEYETVEIAQEAKQTLHGQHYIGHEISICYVHKKASLLDLASAPDIACYSTNSRPALNPRPPSLIGPLRSCYDAPYMQRFRSSRQVLGSIQNIPSRAPPYSPWLSSRSRNVLSDCKPSCR